MSNVVNNVEFETLTRKLSYERGAVSGTYKTKRVRRKQHSSTRTTSAVSIHEYYIAVHAVFTEWSTKTSVTEIREIRVDRRLKKNFVIILGLLFEISLDD